ncbi:MAG: type II toxin-antitoxin system death-on-curing family toxin [Opitutaceae bacterium]
MSTKLGGQIYHLKVADVLEIHSEAISLFGGSEGIREMALLESAVAAPQASFGGESVYTDIVEVAAAYLFFLCSNRPFVDGNKRAALGACIVFLRLNGIEPQSDNQGWEDLTLEVASSKLDREEATQRLRSLVNAQSA